MACARAVVTGGAGFIGSHLVDALVARGVAVTVVDKAAPNPAYANPRAHYVVMHIQDDALRAVFVEVAPNVVFHLAAHIDDRASVADPVANAEDNIIGSLNVFEAARHVRVERMVFASTGVVYGNVADIPTPETVAPRPTTPYGVSKLTGERYLNFYWLLHKIPFLALRLSNVYGPRQDGSKECGVIAIATTQLLAGNEVCLNNDGMTTRDYIHVDDVVAALCAAADSAEVGVLNIGTGVETTTRDVLAQIAAAMQVPFAPTSKPEVMDAVKRIALDIRRADALVHWKPTVALAEGIVSTVEWYRKKR